MVLLDEVKRRVADIAPEVKDLESALGIGAQKRRLNELETKSAMPEFYNNQAESAKVFGEMSAIRERLENYGRLESLLADAETWLELWAEGDEDAAPYKN